MQPAFLFEAPGELRARQREEQPHDAERDRGVLDQLDYGVRDGPFSLSKPRMNPAFTNMPYE